MNEEEEIFSPDSVGAESGIAKAESALVVDSRAGELEEAEQTEEVVLLDQNAKTLSPGMLVLKRFFRSKLSIVGLTMIIVLFLFAFLGPVIFDRWGETQRDSSGKEEIVVNTIEYTNPDGTTSEVVQVTVTQLTFNSLAPPSLRHWLGTDKEAQDVFTRCMYGGRISLLISLIVVFLETIIGVILGGLAGYFGKWVDQVIMRIVDIFSCVPTFPILLLAGSLIDSFIQEGKLPADSRIYCLMAILTFLGWAGTARIVRGQILSLREQEYMTAAEAMGLGTGRKIFKHLIPNVMPQLIVSMTLGLGSTILYEASLSYLNLGVKAPYAAWGTMINIITSDVAVLQNNPWVWVPPGVLIILAVLAFNFIGDGLRDALDPRMKR